jgi:hypothetical protein
MKIFVATTYNSSKPDQLSYEQVNVLDTFKYGDYKLCLHEHHNKVIGGTNVSEFYTGRHIKSFSMNVSKDDAEKIESLKKATEQYLDGFSDIVGDKIKDMKKVNDD